MKESISREGFPVYYTGDKKILDYLKWKFENTLMIPKPYIFSIPYNVISIQEEQLSILEPIICIEILSEIQRENLIKNRNLIKENIHYIYFPASIRVDETIYKIYLNSFQNLIKESPRSCKNNFTKLIIWEEGKGEHSIASQTNKINQVMSNIAKIQIQKRIQQYNIRIRQIQDRQPTPKDLMELFKLKIKLSTIFQFLKLHSTSNQILQGLWKQLLHNKIILSPYSQEKFRSPFIQNNINILLNQFEKPESYLKIINFVFIQMFKGLLGSIQNFQAMKKLRFFIDYTFTNLLKKTVSSDFQIRRHFWAIQLIDECQRIQSKGNYVQPIIIGENQQYSQILVGLAVIYRTSTEKIGSLLYGFTFHSIFPTTLEKQLSIVLSQMSLNDKSKDKLQKQPQARINVGQLISNEMLPKSISLIIDSFKLYKKFYIGCLQKVHKAFINSSLQRFGQSLKLSIMKAYIMYFYQQDVMIKSKIILNNKHIKWPSLQIIQKLYKVAFLKVLKNYRQMNKYILSLLVEQQICQYKDHWNSLCSFLTQEEDTNEQDNIFSLGQLSRSQFKQVSLYIYKMTTILSIKSFDKFPMDQTFIEIQQQNNEYISLPVRVLEIKQDKIQCQFQTKRLLQFKFLGIKIKSKGINFLMKNSSKEEVLQIINNAKLLMKHCQGEIINIYENLWNPMTFTFVSNGSDQIIFLKFQSNLEINNKIKIDNLQYTQIDEISKLNFKESNFKNEIMLQMYCKPKSGEGQKNSQIQITFKVKHHNEEYEIKKKIQYIIKACFQVSYYYIEQLQQYTIKNITNHELNLIHGQEEWVLQRQQELKFNSNIIKIGLNGCQKMELNLEKIINNIQILKPKNIQFFNLQIEDYGNKIRTFQKIGIKSSEVGKLRIKDLYNENYEFIGKVEGTVTYRLNQEQKQLINLWIVPTKSGKIILPQIWINKKKGIWNNQFYIEVT